MVYKIEPYVVDLEIAQSSGEVIKRQFDAAAAFDQLSLLQEVTPQEQVCERLIDFCKELLEIEDCSLTMAAQIQGAIIQGYEEFKKKAPQELVSHLNTVSTRPDSTFTPPPPSTPTSPASEPSGNSASAS